jgi:predicted RNA binding protein YcfA (HicA-like mRNA interferase family)
MGINYAQLRGVTARELISALIRDGFALDRQVGAHQHYLHPDGRRVTVSFHRPGETFGIKTLRAMIELQAGWSEDDLKRLRLMK